MNKKAESIILMIFEVLVVVIVVGLVFRVAVSYGKSETITKINIANDVVMMINTLVGSPGNAVVEYPHNLTAYNLVLSSEEIVVFKKTDQQSEYTRRNIRLPAEFSGEGFREKTEKVCLRKEQKKIILDECYE